MGLDPTNGSRSAYSMSMDSPHLWEVDYESQRIGSSSCCPNYTHTRYSLLPKTILLLLEFFCYKWLSTLSAWLRIEAWSQNTSTPNLLYQEVFQHCHFRGHYRVVVVFYFINHTYNYSFYGQRASISPKLETRTIILGQREYHISSSKN